MNRSSNKEVIFIDKGIENFASLAEKLVKSSDVDYQIVYLDKAENAFAQMADYLSKQNNLDAIHIFSHGAKAAIKLADNYIGEKDLKNHAEALKIIGNSLRQNGDIMLYGCDIAASEEGERFIQTFADLTGADISASQDKTGNSTIYNANWVLESTIGNIESQTLHADEFDGLLYSGTRHYSISLYNQALGGNREAFDYDFSTNDYVFTFGSVEQNQEITLASFLGSSLKLDYGLKVTPLTFGIPIEFTVSEGMFDLYYPVSINVATPSSVVMGDRYVIKTGLDGIYSPQMNIRGPELDIDIKAIFKTSIEAHMGVEWDTFFDRDAVALVGETNDGGESYISKMWGIDEEVSLVTFNREGFSILDKKYTSGLNFENDFISFSTMNNVADAYRLKGQASAYLDENGYLDMRARLVNDEPIMSFSADLDDIVGGMLELFPATKVAGELIRALDGSYTAAEGKSVIGWGDISTNLSYSILSLNATFNLKSVLEVSLDVKDIIVDLISDSGERKYGSIGDEFIFTAPDIEQHWTEIIATYGLKSVLSSRFGFEGSISLDLSMLGLEGKVLGIDVPAFFEKDGTPSNYLIEETWGGEIFSYFPKSLENSYELYQELGRESFLISYGDYTDIPQLNTDSKLSQISVSVIGAEQIETNRYSIEEGNNGIKYVTFRVSRTGDLNKTLSINYLFELGDGIDNKDFENIEQLDSRQIHFNKYEKYKDITIGIKGDILPESDESFVFKLLPTNNINILNIETTVTIYSDDLVQYKMKSEEKSYTGSQRDEEIFGNNENNVIFAGAGNDIIHAGAGNDFIHGGSGNDILYISSNNGSDYFNGGSGTDTLNIDWSQSSGYMYLKNHNTGSSYNYNFDNHSGFESIKSYLESTDELTYQYNSDNYIKFKNVEKLNIRGTKYNDLIIYKGGNEYHGNGGIDTFYADWSKWTANVVWKNGGTTSNNVNVTGMERLLIQTGAGNDSISLDANRQNDYISTGNGDDTLNIIHNNGSDYFDGGSGTDTLNIDWSQSSGHMYLKNHNTGSSYNYNFDNHSGFESIKSYLESTDELAYHNSDNYIKFKNVEKLNIRGTKDNDLIIYKGGNEYHGNGGIDTFYADWSKWTANVVWKNGGTTSNNVNVTGMERLLIQTGAGNDSISLDSNRQADYISTGNGDDTLNIIHNNGSDYFDGGSGTDTLNIDWSQSSGKMYLYSTSRYYYDGNNGFESIKSYLESTDELTYKVNDSNYITFKNVEKLNIRGTKDNDLIIYKGGNEYHGNGGIDTFYADWSKWTANVVWKNGGTTSNNVNVTGMERLLIQTGAGNDSISLDANRQNDYISTGNGDDTLNIIHNNGSDYFDGGSGTDTLNIDWSQSSGKMYLYSTSRYYYDGNNGFESIKSYLESTDELTYKVNDSNYITFKNVEKLNIRGTKDNDLIIYKGGNEYHGNGGIDTFYADWSKWTANVVWKNGGTTSNNVNVTGMERLLIQTGAGNDSISLDSNRQADYISTGNGDDTLNIIHNNGSDYFDGGSGTDILNIDWSQSSGKMYLYSSRYNYDSTNGFESIKSYLRSTDELTYKVNDSNYITFKNVEKLNIRGTKDNDLIIYKGGNEYHGNGGIDTFYADWSKWTANVVWKNGGTTSNNVNVTGMERLLIQTGAGNDSISLDSNRQADYISTGNGDDTLNIIHNNGSDYFDGGSGTDTLNIDWSQSSGKMYLYSTSRYYYDGNNGFESIKSYLESTDELTYKVNDSNYITFKNVEKLNIRGTKDNDLIIYKGGNEYHGNDGIDTFYADWSKWTANVVWKNGGTTSNNVNVTGMERLLIQTGAGNDSISLDANRQDDYISTGKGNDTLSIIGNNGHDYFNGGTGTDAMNLNWSANKNGSISFRTYDSNTATSYIKELNYSSSFSDIKAVLSNSYNEEFAFNNGNANNSVRFASVEKINIRGSDGNDLILYWNGSQYHGNGGGDTFYADWSSWKENIVWKNGGTSIAKKVNVTGMERLLIQTGAGNDNISLDANRQNDYISTGKGNDTLSIIGNNGHDYFNGGTGTDAMNLNWSANKNGSISFRTYGSNTATSYTKLLDYSSSFSDIESTLADSSNKEFAFNNGNANNSVRFASVEKINIRGSDGNDLILYWNGSQYHGNGGIDTFYADWSSWKENIVWKNGGTSIAKKVNVTGVERLLIQTGAGNDSISLDANRQNDYISTGKGNDTLSIIGNNGHDYFNGGTGTDAMNLNWSANKNGSISFRTYDSNTATSYIKELNYSSSFSDIKAALSNSYNEEFAFNNGNANNSVRFASVEKINIRGSDGNDLILYWNGSQYHGNGGIDTFYADWSSWQENIVWKNGGTSVAKKVNVTGMDRLFLTSGTGTDHIDLSDTVLNNEVHANIGHDTVIGGAGNDWLYGDAGRDTLYGGAGNDKLFGGTGNDTLYGDDGNDELYGGAGNDTLTGGKGNDVFVFDTALGKNNIDTIVDFSTSDDKIALSKAIFTGIRYINSSIFTTGKAATDSKQRIIYDDKSGKLYYDEDGSGAGKAVHFANLNKELDLDYNHFILA